MRTYTYTHACKHACMQTYTRDTHAYTHAFIHWYSYLQLLTYIHAGTKVMCAAKVDFRFFTLVPSWSLLASGAWPSLLRQKPNDPMLSILLDPLLGLMAECLRRLSNPAAIHNTRIVAS